MALPGLRRAIELEPAKRDVRVPSDNSTSVSQNRLVARPLRKLDDALAPVERELLPWVIVRGRSGRGS